jgi:hypothetical protein
MRLLLALCAVGFGTVALAQQPYPLESVMRFQVWNGTEWTNEVSVLPGSRVEWRVTVSYTGANTNIFALAAARYQPTISNWDNDGGTIDRLGAWRNGGISGQPPGGAFGMLDDAEGSGHQPLETYSRYNHGFVGMGPHVDNTMTSFLHQGGSGGAPAGSWLRIAGSFVTTWPRDGTLPWTVNDGNRILRGVGAEQVPFTHTGPHPNFVPGTQDLVLLRQAVTLSEDASLRTLEITTGEWSMLRAGGVNSQDNRRYIVWHDDPNATTFTGPRTSVLFESALIHVVPTIPAPGSAFVGVGACLLAARRRR